MVEELFYWNFHLIQWNVTWFEEFLSLIFQVCYMHFRIIHVGWKANMDNADMCLSGNHTEIAQMVERSSSNRRVSGFIPGSVTLSHCWFKKLFSLYSSFSVIRSWVVSIDNIETCDLITITITGFLTPDQTKIFVLTVIIMKILQRYFHHI